MNDKPDVMALVTQLCPFCYAPLDETSTVCDDCKKAGKTLDEGE